MILKQQFPYDWYYAPVYNYRYVFATGVMTFVWWVWIFPIIFESSKHVFNFPPYAVIMFIIWLSMLVCCLGLEKSRIRPMDYDPETYMLMEEDYPEKKPKYNYTKVELDAPQNAPCAGSSTSSAENTPAMYTARTGRESMDSHHTTAVNVLTTQIQTENTTEKVEMKDRYNKTEETSSSSSSSSSNAEDLQLQPELSVDDENEVDATQEADKTLTPRQIFFSDMLRHSEEPVPRDRRSCFVDRPVQTLAEKRKSMPLYLYIGETRTLSYTDQEAVAEDARKTFTSGSESLSSPAQHVTSDELRSNMSRLRDEQQRLSTREKHSSSSSGAEYFIANVSKQKSVTSEVYITIDDQQKSCKEFTVVGSNGEQKLVTDERRVVSGDNDDALSDCVFLDETATSK